MVIENENEKKKWAEWDVFIRLHTQAFLPRYFALFLIGILLVIKIEVENWSVRNKNQVFFCLHKDFSLKAVHSFFPPLCDLIFW